MSLFPHMQIRFSNDAAHIWSRRLHVQEIMRLDIRPLHCFHFNSFIYRNLNRSVCFKIRRIKDIFILRNTMSAKST